MIYFLSSPDLYQDFQTFSQHDPSPYVPFYLQHCFQIWIQDLEYHQSTSPRSLPGRKFINTQIFSGQILSAKLRSIELVSLCVIKDNQYQQKYIHHETPISKKSCIIWNLKKRIKCLVYIAWSKCGYGHIVP